MPDPNATPPAGAPAGGTPAGAPPNASTTPPAGGGSVLAPPPAPLHELVPEKYLVKNGEAVDLEATIRKLAPGYSELHKRLVDGGAPPESAEAYDVKELPNGVKFEDLKKDPATAAWLKGAHSRGMTNKQIEHVFNGLADFLGDVGTGEAALSMEDCTAELRKVWTTDADFAKNTAAATRGAQAFAAKAGIDFAQLEARYGNDPVIVRLLAAIGAEVSEAAPLPTGAANPGGTNVDEEIANLTKQMYGMQPHDPQREVLRERLLKLYERKHPRRHVA